MRFTQRTALLVFASLSLLLPAASAQTSRTTIIHQPEDPSEAASRETLAKAQAAMDRQDFAGAAKICADFLQNNPDDAAVHFQLGYADTALRKPDDAADEFRKASELDPKMGPAFLNLGLTLLNSKSSLSDKTLDEALDALEQADELMPDQARVKYALAMALERSGKNAEAIDSLRQSVKLDPRDFAAQLELARQLLNANQLDDSERAFRKAIDLLPKSGAAHLGLAQCLLKEKKTEEGAAQLALSLQYEPENVEARLEHASLLADLNKNDEALAELDRAVALRPEDPATLKLRALVEFRLKNYPAALTTLQKLEVATPADPDVHARIGHLLLEEKDYPGASKELATAFRADPSQTEVLRDLIAATYLGGNYPAALELLDLLSKRETLSNGSWFVRANCYDKIGKVQEALDAYRKFLELNAGQTNDEYFLASARARTLERELKEKK
jgi:tetratricopeptide (TPR) repeat protein